MSFIKKVFSSAIKYIRSIIADLVSNIESVIILGCATLGITTLLAEIPFHFMLPAILDGALIIPFISCLIITGLIFSIKWRNHESTI